MCSASVAATAVMGAIFDFETKDYLEKSVSPKCAVCNNELEVDLKE
jgi:hypothetical protein